MPRKKNKANKKRKRTKPTKSAPQTNATPATPAPVEKSTGTSRSHVHTKIVIPKFPLTSPPSEAAPDERVVLQISEFVYIRAFFFIGLVSLALYVIFHLRNVLAPVMIGLALAYLINPIVDLMQKRGVKRNVAIWLLVATLSLFVAVGWLFFVPKLLNSLERLGALFTKIPPLLVKGKLWMESTFNVHFPGSWVEALTTWGQELKDYAPKIIIPLKAVMAAIFTGGMGILSWFFTLLLIPLFTFYFLKGYDNIRHQVVDYIPLQFRDRLMGRMSEIDRILSGFMRGQLTVSLIVGSMYMILLSTIQLPLAPAIAVGGAVLNIVPYLGFLTTYLIALVAVLVEFQLQWQFFVVLVLMMGVHMIDIFYITPVVVGEQVGLSEIVVIFAVLAGGQLFGLIGVLLAVPLAAVIKVAFAEVLVMYRKSHFYTGASTDEP